MRRLLKQLPLPSGWKEYICSRELLAQATSEHAGEIRRSFAWCSPAKRHIWYFYGPSIAGLFWLRLHERGHAAGIAMDCCRTNCVMSKSKGWRVWSNILLAAWRRGDWFCPECRAKLRNGGQHA